MGNGVVLVMAGILFGWDKALYSIIFQFTSTQTIHLLYQAYNKVTLFIVTDNPKAVYEAIYQVTNHSATEFSATGMYSNEGRKMILFCGFQHRSKGVDTESYESGSTRLCKCSKNGYPHGTILSERELLRKQSGKMIIIS